MGAAVVEHGAPTRRWRRHAESKETHGGFGENGSSHADRRLHDYRLNNIREHVTHDNAQIACAERARRFNKFAFACGKDLSADQAGVADPSSKRERENEVKDAGSAERDESYRQQDSGE